MSTNPAIILQNPVTYTGSLLPLKAGMLAAPKEGNKVIPANIPWTTLGGPNNTVYFDLSTSGSVIQMSQISTLYVNNLACQAPVTFYFPDTNFALEVPGTAFGYFPIITTQTKFYAIAPAALDGDLTTINILNFLVPPTALVSEIPLSQLIHHVNNGSNFVPNSVQNIPLVTAGLGGIIVNLTVLNGASFCAAGSLLSTTITDSTGAIFYVQGGFIHNAGASGVQSPPHLAVNLQNTNIPFTNGLSVILTSQNTADWATAFVELDYLS